MFKGIALHTVGKIAFVLGNFVIQYFLQKILTIEAYGVYGVIIAIINFDYLFLNNGVRQAVSNQITQGNHHIPDLIKKGMGYQLVIIAAVFVVNFFGAPFLAQMLNKQAADPAAIAQLTDYIRIAAFIIPFMGVYFVALGVFNGFKLFVIEASIVTLYPILKMIVIPFVAGNMFPDALISIEMGFLFAGIIIMAISLIFLYKKRALYDASMPKIAHKPYIKSAVSFSLLFCIVAIIMNIDTLILKGVSGSNLLTGAYTAAVQWGKASYYLLGAFYIVVLPVVTKYYKENQLAKAATSIRDLLTIILAIVLPVTVIIAASSGTVLTVFASKNPEYAIAAPALALLSFGTFCLGMTLVFNMITSAANKKKFTTILSLLMLAAFVVVCVVLTNLFSLTGTGASSLVVCFVTMMVSAVYAKKLFGQFWEKKHFKILIVNAVVFVLTMLVFHFVPVHNLLLLLVLYAGLYFLGFGILRALKIISIKQIKDALKKEKQAEQQEVLDESDLEA